MTRSGRNEPRRLPADRPVVPRIGERGGWSGYLSALGLVLAATTIGKLASPHLALPDLVMLYLLVVGVVATVFGRGPSLLASSLSVLGYDFFFITPYYTFYVADPRHLLTFVMMFAAGLILSGLTNRVRQKEREVRAAELRAQTEELRSSLLSAVSHDLRTPLGAITGAATTLRNGNETLTARQRADLSETVCEEAERMERLVRNLLDMMRLESGVVELKREWVPVEEIVGSALTRMEQQLAGRSIHTALAPDLPLVSVDPVLFELVFVNLLENATKYTPAEGPIEISARTLNGDLVMEVADRGPGFRGGPPSRLFEQFARGQEHRAPGVGLGLAICRAIAQAHGGSIAAEQRPGGGALFRVLLPLIERPPAVPLDRLDEGAGGERV